MKGHFGVSPLGCHQPKKGVSHRAKVPGRPGRECQPERASPLSRPPQGAVAQGSSPSLQLCVPVRGGPLGLPRTNSTGLTLVLTLTTPTHPTDWEVVRQAQIVAISM